MICGGGGDSEASQLIRHGTSSHWQPRIQVLQPGFFRWSGILENRRIVRGRDSTEALLPISMADSQWMTTYGSLRTDFEQNQRCHENGRAGSGPKSDANGRGGIF